MRRYTVELVTMLAGILLVVPYTAAAQQRDTIPSIGILSLLSPCLLYTSPSPRDRQKSRMPSSA